MTTPEQPAPFGYPPYGAPPAAARNGMGTAALVLGIVALVLCWTIVIGFVCGVLALIFGIIGRNRAKRGEATNGGAALAGAICGGIGLAVTIVLIAIGAVFFAEHKDEILDYGDCINQAQTDAEREACDEQFRQQLDN